MSASGFNFSSSSFSTVSSPKRSNRALDLLNVTYTKSTMNKRSCSKIMREVNYLNKDLNRPGKLTNLNNYKNRPMVNLSRPEFDLNSRHYIAQSPTVKRRNFLVTGNVLKNYKGNKNYNFMNQTNNLKTKTTDLNSADAFLRELQPNRFKNSFLSKFSPSKRSTFF